MSEQLKPHEQAVLFQYVFDGKQMPEWADQDSRKLFARLLNKSQSWANRAYERAKQAGYLDKG